MKDDFTKPFKKESGWLNKGGYIGDYSTEDYSDKSFFSVIYMYFMTNNHLRNTLLFSIGSILISGILFAVLDNSNANQLINVEGNIYNSLGSYAILKMSCIFGTLIPTLILGYYQYKYIITTKAFNSYILGFISFSYSILFMITYGFMFLSNKQYIDLNL